MMLLRKWKGSSYLYIQYEMIDYQQRVSHDHAHTV